MNYCAISAMFDWNFHYNIYCLSICWLKSALIERSITPWKKVFSVELKDYPSLSILGFNSMYVYMW